MEANVPSGKYDELITFVKNAYNTHVFVFTYELQITILQLSVTSMPKCTGLSL